MCFNLLLRGWWILFYLFPSCLSLIYSAFPLVSQDLLLLGLPSFFFLFSSNSRHYGFNFPPVGCVYPEDTLWPSFGSHTQAIVYKLQKYQGPAEEGRKKARVQVPCLGHKLERTYMLEGYTEGICFETLNVLLTHLLTHPSASLHGRKNVENNLPASSFIGKKMWM